MHTPDLTDRVWVSTRRRGLSFHAPGQRSTRCGRWHGDQQDGITARGELLTVAEAEALNMTPCANCYEERPKRIMPVIRPSREGLR